MQDIVQAIGQVSLFGPCDVSDLQSVESERRERDKRIQLEKEKRLEEITRAENERKKQEHEDYTFAVKEQEKLNAVYRSPPKMFGRGRGAMIARLLESPPPPKLPQGRGRRQPNNKDSRFTRDTVLSDQITQTTGGEKIYRNSLQERYWQGDSSVNYTLQGGGSSYNNNKGDDAAACSINTPNDDNDNLPSANFSNEDPASNYLDDGACAVYQSHYRSSFDDLTTNQFEDTDTNSSTYMSMKQEMSPFESASSSVSASPVQPLPASSGQLSRKPPRSRLAAKFLNPISTSTENSNESHYDFFAEPSTQHQTTAPSHHNGGGIPFNSITASQRIIGNGEFKSIDFFNNHKLHYGNGKNFRFNPIDFPPL